MQVKRLLASSCLTLFFLLFCSVFLPARPTACSLFEVLCVRRCTGRPGRGSVRDVDVRVGPQGYLTVSVGQRCSVLSSASLSRDLCMSVSFLHLVVCPRSVCGTDSVTWAVGCFPLLGGSVLGFLGASTWTGQGFRAIGRALCAMLANMFSSHPPYAPLFPVACVRLWV